MCSWVAAKREDLDFEEVNLLPLLSNAPGYKAGVTNDGDKRPSFC